MCDNTTEATQSLIFRVGANRSDTLIGDQIGKIAPGYLADLIIVDGDPLVDIKSIRNVESVYLTGVHVYEKPTETAQDEE